MPQPALLIERDGHIVTLTMNRPDVKNAINMEMLCRLADAWQMIDDDPDVRCAILTGTGADFCAGADLDKLVARSMQNLAPEDEWETRIRADSAVIAWPPTRRAAPVRWARWTKHNWRVRVRKQCLSFSKSR